MKLRHFCLATAGEHGRGGKMGLGRAPSTFSRNNKQKGIKEWGGEIMLKKAGVATGKSQRQVQVRRKQRQRKKKLFDNARTTNYREVVQGHRTNFTPGGRTTHRVGVQGRRRPADIIGSRSGAAGRPENLPGPASQGVFPTKKKGGDVRTIHPWGAAWGNKKLSGINRLGPEAIKQNPEVRT